MTMITAFYRWLLHSRNPSEEDPQQSIGSQQSLGSPNSSLDDSSDEKSVHGKDTGKLSIEAFRSVPDLQALEKIDAALRRAKSTADVLMLRTPARSSMEVGRHLAGYKDLIRSYRAHLDANLHMLSQQTQLPILLTDNNDYMMHKMATFREHGYTDAEFETYRYHEAMKEYKLLKEKLHSLEDLLEMYRLIIDKISTMIEKKETSPSPP